MNPLELETNLLSGCAQEEDVASGMACALMTRSRAARSTPSLANETSGDVNASSSAGRRDPRPRLSLRARPLVVVVHLALGGKPGAGSNLAPAACRVVHRDLGRPLHELIERRHAAKVVAQPIVRERDRPGTCVGGLVARRIVAAHELVDEREPEWMPRGRDHEALASLPHAASRREHGLGGEENGGVLHGVRHEAVQARGRTQLDVEVCVHTAILPQNGIAHHVVPFDGAAHREDALGMLWDHRPHHRLDVLVVPQPLCSGCLPASHPPRPAAHIVRR